MPGGSIAPGDVGLGEGCEGKVEVDAEAEAEEEEEEGELLGVEELPPADDEDPESERDFEDDHGVLHAW